ncbi:hypothetical protein FSP39_006046 [Pinctada imbricata]|uniref:Gamma-aminobutyric acid type B receptor subunit 2 n=1 Tax=Pinctada imbricata TaxID=66713 RepID=A0AA89C391_PINIB|nr:hypothetical protein FSP39_006046 [Pinctada imbricata]
MVMGSACSDVTETLAEIVPNLGLILISYASTYPTLSEREKFKTFFRLAHTDSTFNTARRMFIQHFGWRNVGIIHQNKESFDLTIDNLSKSLRKQNITILSSGSFRSEDDIRIKLLALKEAGARIIIGGFTEVTAKKAYKLAMYGPKHVWILVGEYRGRWWERNANISCSNTQLKEVVDRIFLTKSMFLRDYHRHNGTYPLSPFALTAYDTVWTIAHTLSAALNVSYDDAALYNLTEMMRLMADTNFVGLSARDKRRIVSVYDPDLGALNFHCQKCIPISWHDGRIPRDKTMTYLKESEIDDNVFLVVFVLCIIGIIVAMSFLTFNLYHRQSRFIKLSSPNLNNVAVLGCILVYIGITLLGVDDKHVHDHVYSIFCTVRAFVFAAGFSLSFGAMFTKTYRVHQIFTRASHGLIKTKLLKDKQLMLIIGTLLVIDSCVVLLWFFVDPMQRKTVNVTSELYSEDPDVIYISQISTCHSVHMDKWLGSFYAFKGLLLVFGVYMAWETRNVKIPILNDSNYIGLNVYNVVIMSSIVVVLSNILSEKPTLAFTMESAVMLLSTSVTLCLLFVPKIYTIVTAKGNPVVASSGILVEDRTRRFVVDDRREIYHRAEVQNRAYKREIIQLGHEICRLERLLSIPTEPYPNISEDLLYQLPESTVDPSPEFRRKQFSDFEMEQSISISDGGEVCIGHSDETSDGTLCSPTAELPRIQRRMSIREVATKKLLDLRRTLSFRPQTKQFKRYSRAGMRRRQRNESERGWYQQIGRFDEADGSDDDNAAGTVLREDSDLLGRDMAVLGSIEYLQPLVLPSPFARSRSKRLVKKEKWQIKVTEQTSDEETIEISSRDVEMKECRPIPLKPYLPVPNIYHSLPCERNMQLSFAADDDIVTKISRVDVTSGSRPLSKSLSYSSALARERRHRIQKLQRDLVNIQKELKDLQELEYIVTKV